MELADIIRQYQAAYAQKHVLTPTEHAVLDAVDRCRTAALGRHVDVCLQCGFKRPSYNSFMGELFRAQILAGLRRAQPVS